MGDSTGSHNPNYSITKPRFTDRNGLGPLSSRRFDVGKDPALGGGGHQARVRENAKCAQLRPAQAIGHVSWFGDRSSAIAAAGQAHHATAAINHRDPSGAFGEFGQGHVKGTC